MELAPTSGLAELIIIAVGFALGIAFALIV
jgi:hypothetical protein